VAPDETAGGWNALSAEFDAAVVSAPSNAASTCWRYLKSPVEIPACEAKLLRQSGKSQDGIVSRYLNRHLSRFVSRFLLRYDLTPSTVTVALFVLPVAAFFCLARGDYFGIVAGAFLFQLYSMLDGCDGEIARATYQESTRGGRIDDFLDMIGSVLFVLGLGLGLFRWRSSFYLLEGALCAAVIVVNEWFLRWVHITDQPESEKLTGALYPRHRRLLAGRLGQLLGDNIWWWIVQFTKRDAAILAFLLLAVADQSPWILHLWLIVSGATLILSARSSQVQKGTG
jgi:phosphatidylglycerophosphate synthase